MLLIMSEDDLTRSFFEFQYFYIVTASTVGYGDMSPTTIPGQLYVAWFMVPTAIALFGLYITKISQAVSSHLRRGLQGKMDYRSELPSV